MNNNYKNRTKIVKKALTKAFNGQKVSVRRGRGTAYSWVTVKITLDAPDDCKCNWSVGEFTGEPVRDMIQLRADGFPQYVCKACEELIEREEERANNIINQSGAEFGMYYVDSGIPDHTSRELHVNVDTRPNGRSS